MPLSRPRRCFRLAACCLIALAAALAAPVTSVLADDPAVWQPVASDAPTRAVPTRIVDFGHDFIREAESAPVHQYYLHRWRLKPGADGMMTAWAPVETRRDIDVDGDGETSDDSVAAMPLSLENPLSPIAPWYDNDANSAHFYGGIVFRFANQPNGRFTEIGINQEHDGPPHHPRDNWTLFYELFDLHAAYQAHGLYLWLKKDFLLGGDAHQVSFDENSELSLFLQRYFMGFEGCRWVVQNGDTIYISEEPFKGAGPRPGSGHGKIHTVRPAQLRWATYQPSELDLRFDPEAATFAKVEFDDVRAVGWYLFKDTMAPAYTGFKWYAFEATANVHRPERPSEFLAMKQIDSAAVGPAFYGGVTEVPYSLWKRVLRQARSNVFAAGPRGFNFVTDGDMGSMDLLDGEHHRDEPVTDVTVHDLAAWCNALSMFEMREPVYFTDAELTKPFTQAVQSPVYLQPRGLPTLYVKWAADGYRLPTLAEARAMAGPASRHAGQGAAKTQRVGMGDPTAAGLYDVSGNAWEIVWTFGDQYDPAAGSPVMAVGGGAAMVPHAESAGSQPRHPLAGARIVRREAGLAAPADVGAAAQAGDGFAAVLPVDAPAQLPDPPQIALVPFGDRAIARTEITFDQWQRVYRWAVANGYQFDADGDMGSMDAWSFQGKPDDWTFSPDEPVTDITLYDAMVWCNALSEMRGLRPAYYTSDSLDEPYRKAFVYRPLQMTLGEASQANADRIVGLTSREALERPVVDPDADGFRLPNVDEYAELLRDGRGPSWEGGFAQTPRVAWCFDTAGGRTHPVGQLAATGPGVQDIAGNAAELVVPDTRGAAGWSSRFNGGRVGGSYLDLAHSLILFPRQQPRGVGYPDLGFRVVKQAGAKRAAAENRSASDAPRFVALAAPAKPEANAVMLQTPPSLQGTTFRGNQQRTGVLDVAGVAAQPKIAWRYKAGGPVRSSPVVVDGVVYVGTHGDEFLALDAKTGELRWRVDTDGPVSGSAAIDEGEAFFVSEGGTLYAVALMTGEVRFSQKVSRERPAGTPALVGNLVLVPTGNGGGSDQVRMGAGAIVGADRATGKVIWRGPAGPQGFAAPAVGPGTVYTSLAVNASGAIDLSNRRVKWRYNPGGQDRQWVNPVLLDDQVLVIGSMAGSISLLDAKTGRRAWRTFIRKGQLSINNGGWPGYEVLAAPAVVQDTIVVPGNDGGLQALRRGDGELIWRYDAAAGIQSGPMSDGRLVYFGDNAGVLHAVRLSTGDVAWTLDLGSRIGTSPWPADGAVYVGTDGGELIAISGPGQP